jgi:hypothetical protein
VEKGETFQVERKKVLETKA